MKKSTALVVLVITTLLSTAAGIVGLLPALMSPMLFDAPGSTHKAENVALFFGALTFPLTCLVAIVLSWLLYRSQKFAVACCVAFLPGFHFLIVVVLVGVLPNLAK